MQLSEIQIQKLTLKFELLDNDGNGTIEYDDFKRVLELLADIRGLAEDSADYAALEGTNRALWHALEDFCDANGDGRISLKEWLDYHSNALFYEREFLSVIPGFDTTVEAMAEFFYQLLDGDGDGEVSAQDYFEFCLAHGVEEAEAQANFMRLDLNGDGKLSKDEVQKLVAEFYQSEDPSAPGNWFFGSL